MNKLNKNFSNKQGILYALTGYTSWVFSDASLKFIGGTSLPKYEIMIFMSISALLMTGLITAARGKTKNLCPKHPLQLFILGLILTVNLVFLFWAYSRLSLVSLYSITFMGPMLTAILASIFMKERLRKAQIFSIFMGFMGVIIAINPFGPLNTRTDWLGYGAAFLVLILNTVYMLLLRIYGKDEHHENMAFYPRLVMLTAGLLSLFFLPFVPFSMKELFIMLGAGFFAGLGWIVMTVACQRSPASIVAPYRYSQIVMAALLGYVIWQDVPTFNCITGSVVIIISGLHNAHCVRKVEVAA